MSPVSGHAANIGKTSHKSLNIGGIYLFCHMYRLREISH